MKTSKVLFNENRKLVVTILQILENNVLMLSNPVEIMTNFGKMSVHGVEYSKEEDLIWMQVSEHELINENGVQFNTMHNVFDAVLEQASKIVHDSIENMSEIMELLNYAIPRLTDNKYAVNDIENARMVINRLFFSFKAK